MKTIKFPGGFSGRVTGWFEKNRRGLPWRLDRNPYHIWISEIMLQQTRAETVKEYYTRFITALPDISSLASVSDDRLQKLWEGLGYYRRAGYLKRAANIILSEFGGTFPGTYEQILSLPGIGAYTAGAISSIAFGLPVPAVDGNVLRVVSRFCGIENTDLPEVKSAVTGALQKIYPKNNAADFTEGLMELGAMVCRPNGLPVCGACPLAADCFALRQGQTEKFPRKMKKPARKKEQLTVFLLRHKDQIALRRRDENGLLGSLFEFPNTAGHLLPAEALAYLKSLGIAVSKIRPGNAHRHLFTHIEWDMISFDAVSDNRPPDFCWVTKEELDGRFALPSAFRIFLR